MGKNSVPFINMKSGDFMPDDRSVEWYKAEIVRLEKQQNDHESLKGIGCIILGIIVIVLFFVISVIAHVWINMLAAAGVFIVILGVALVYGSYKRKDRISDLRNELAAMEHSVLGKENQEHA